MKSFGCRCAERAKPVKERNWGVSQRNSRCSAFDGYVVKWSPYSFVICLSCGDSGRTNASYVPELRDIRPSRPGEIDPHGKGWVFA